MSSTTALSADFSCAICFDTATEPVVTRCGHLFCWECLDHWLHSASGAPECPVCKGRVDDRIVGDIIPLYGKGRQPRTNKPASDAYPQGSGGATAANTTTTASAAATNDALLNPEAAAATADPAQEAFFNRPTSYSYAAGRDTRRTPPAALVGSRPAPQAQQQQEQHHPRPNADRAPPHPRPPHQQQQHGPLPLNPHGMPLTVGSSVFFFGGGGGVLFSLMLIIVWALYNYAPWRDWRREGLRWYRRVRGLPEPAGEPQNNGAAGAVPNGDTMRAASPAAAGVAEELPTQQVMVRNLIFSILAIFVLFQLLLVL